MTRIVTKATPIYILDVVRVELLCKLTKACLTGHTGSSHVNAHGGGHTDTHTHMRCGQKQSLETRCMPGLKMLRTIY